MTSSVTDPSDSGISISNFPEIIQGGMGIAVSGWKLANAVGKAGQMGVVSGTVIDVVHTRILGDGDPGGVCAPFQPLFAH